MASWSARRRTTYAFFTFLVVLIALGAVGFLVFYDAPTCTDGKQNGNEEGVDCGGSCERVCAFQSSPLVTRWSRFFEIAPGRYNALALLENPNIGAEARDVQYIFRLRDAQGVLIYERKGDFYVSPYTRLVPVFESAIITGDRTPARISFTIETDPVWRRVDDEPPEISVTNTVLSDEETTPTLNAVLVNNNIENVSDVEAVAILLDGSGNAVAASRTIVDFIEGGSQTPIVFTWPEPLDHDVVSINIIPLIGPRE